MNVKQLDDLLEVRKRDSRGMLFLVENFSAQIEKAAGIGRAASVPASYGKAKKIVVTGLGGSAIGGDFLRSSLSHELKVPFLVNRHYRLPRLVDKDTLVLAASYSGNTEETLSAYADARRKRAKILCLTSGGELKRLAEKDGMPVVTIPGGMPPRATLGLSVFVPLMVLQTLRFIPPQDRAVAETVTLTRALAERYAPAVPSSRNRAKQLAEALLGRMPVIYGSADGLDTVALRWRGQINENSKSFATSNALPEMNHNEIVGWEVLAPLTRKFAVVFLRDRKDHPRVQMRMTITQTVIRDHADSIIDVWSTGVSPIARMLSLSLLGDFVSVYLAFLYGVDPTPVERIDFLKKSLAKR